MILIKLFSILQKYTVFNMDDLNNRNLMTIFNSLNENLFENHSSEPFEYLLAKSLGHQILKAKILFHRISKVYEVNTTLDQIFAVIRSLQLFEWSEINTDKQIASVFLFCINNGLGDCFLANKLEGLFSEPESADLANEKEESVSQSSSENETPPNKDGPYKPSINLPNVNKAASIDPSKQSSIMIETEDFLQSPVNDELRLTLSKKLVSIASFRKSLQNGISESDLDDSEEEADLVGELPNRYGMSPKTEGESPKAKENMENNEMMSPVIGNQGISGARQTIYDQTNTSFKITLQKSQSMSMVKARKSSALDYSDMIGGLKDPEGLDVRTFMPIQEFCAFGVSDLVKAMIEKSKRKSKKREKLLATIDQRNLLCVFDFNMLDVKNEDELVILIFLTLSQTLIFYLE